MEAMMMAAREPNGFPGFPGEPNGFPGFPGFGAAALPPAPLAGLAADPTALAMLAGSGAGAAGADFLEEAAVLEVVRGSSEDKAMFLVKLNIWMKDMEKLRAWINDPRSPCRADRERMRAELVSSVQKVEDLRRLVWEQLAAQRIYEVKAGMTNGTAAKRDVLQTTSSETAGAAPRQSPPSFISDSHSSQDNMLTQPYPAFPPEEPATLDMIDRAFKPLPGGADASPMNFPGPSLSEDYDLDDADDIDLDELPLDIDDLPEGMDGPLDFGDMPDEMAEPDGQADGERPPPVKKTAQQHGQYRSLYVSNVPFWASANHLKPVFARFGEVKSIHVNYASPPVLSKYAFVNFEQPEDASMAFQAAANGGLTLSPGGRAKARGARDSDPLRVSWAASNGKNRSRHRKNEEAKMQERENQGEEQQEQSQPQQSSGPLGVPPPPGETSAKGSGPRPLPPPPKFGQNYLMANVIPDYPPQMGKGFHDGKGDHYKGGEDHYKGYGKGGKGPYGKGFDYGPPPYHHAMHGFSPDAPAFVPGGPEPPHMHLPRHPGPPELQWYAHAFREKPQGFGTWNGMPHAPPLGYPA